MPFVVSNCYISYMKKGQHEIKRTRHDCSTICSAVLGCKTTSGVEKGLEKGRAPSFSTPIRFLAMYFSFHLEDLFAKHLIIQRGVHPIFLPPPSDAICCPTTTNSNTRCATSMPGIFHFIVSIFLLEI